MMKNKLQRIIGQEFDFGSSPVGKKDMRQTEGTRVKYQLAGTHDGKHRNFQPEKKTYT